MSNNALIQKANNLHKNVSSMLAGQFSPSYSPQKIENVNDILDIANSSKKGLAILFVVSIVISILLLKNFKPSFIMKKKNFYDYGEDEIDTYNLLYYSVIVGVIVFIVSSIFIYKCDSLRGFVFDNSCNMCI